MLTTNDKSEYKILWDHKAGCELHKSNKQLKKYKSPISRNILQDIEAGVGVDDVSKVAKPSAVKAKKA